MDDIKKLLSGSLANMQAALDEINRLGGRVNELETREAERDRFDVERRGLIDEIYTEATRQVIPDEFWDTKVLQEDGSTIPMRETMDTKTEPPARRGPTPEQLAEMEYPGFADVSDSQPSDSQPIAPSEAASLAAELETTPATESEQITPEEAAKLAAELEKPASGTEQASSNGPEVKIMVEISPGKYHEVDLNQLAAENDQTINPRTALDMLAEHQLNSGGDVYLSVDGERVAWQVDPDTAAKPDPEGERNPAKMERKIFGYDNVMTSKAFSDVYLADKWPTPQQKHDTETGEGVQGHEIEQIAAFTAGVNSEWSVKKQQEHNHSDDYGLGV